MIRRLQHPIVSQSEWQMVRITYIHVTTYRGVHDVGVRYPRTSYTDARVRQAIYATGARGNSPTEHNSLLARWATKLGYPVGLLSLCMDSPVPGSRCEAGACVDAPLPLIHFKIIERNMFASKIDIRVSKFRIWAIHSQIFRQGSSYGRDKGLPSSPP